MEAKVRHIPVMLREVLESLAPVDGGVYVDATFGNGGYTEAVLNAADCKVIAIDRDPNVRERAAELIQKYGERFTFKAGQFSQINELIEQPVDGFMFDIGVSSMQLDDACRGFSFAKEAALDMRMSCSGISAADIVNTYGRDELADLIYNYGEERFSRRIAAKIEEYRAQKPIETTTELAQIIYSVLHKKAGQIDPATRTFQALRIAVNNELGELETALSAAAGKLKAGGRLVVVDFHSLEDRIVKNFFKQNSEKKRHVSRYAENLTKSDALFEQVSKVILPRDEECGENPRARSAKLRFAVKTKGEEND